MFRGGGADPEPTLADHGDLDKGDHVADAARPFGSDFNLADRQDFLIGFVKTLMDKLTAILEAEIAEVGVFRAIAEKNGSAGTEAEAVLTILRLVESGELELLSSEASI